MNNFLSIFALVLASFTLSEAGVASSDSSPVEYNACASRNFTTVDVDLVKFAGAWYEMGHSNSFFFGKGCQCTTAEYSVKEDGTLRVLNTCRPNSIESPLLQREASGYAVGPGKFKINFFFGLPIADADYEVVYMDDAYDNAIIVSCSFYGSFVWILSRTPEFDPTTYAKLHSIAFKKGFSLHDFVRTNQAGCWSFSKAADAVIRKEVSQVSPAVPAKCALPTRINNFDVKQLQAQWFIIQTQPDFVEYQFSKDCKCSTVTMVPSPKNYGGTYKASVSCRLRTPTGKLSTFVRPVYEISNVTSYLGHFTQQLFNGISLEHWQIVAHSEDYQHMLLYTCLDAYVGKTFCVHIVSRSTTVPDSIVEEYKSLAIQLGIYREKDWLIMEQSETCIYDSPTEINSIDNSDLLSDSSFVFQS